VGRDCRGALGLPRWSRSTCGRRWISRLQLTGRSRAAGGILLYGTADAIADRLQLVLEARNRDRRSAELAALREILDHADFDAAYQHGRTLSLAEAITVVQDIPI
jgi:hypothetical protein